MTGTPLRSDVVDVYLFRRGPQPGVIHLVQFLRVHAPLKDTWHPIMGHMHEGETAITTAWREMREESGLTPHDPAFLGMWAMEQLHPYYIAALNCIMFSPRFAVEVAPWWEPTLNEEHAAWRWVPATSLGEFMWPGQRAVACELLGWLGGSTMEAIRVLPDGQADSPRADKSA